MVGRLHSYVNKTKALFRHLSCPASLTTSKPGSCMLIGLGPSKNLCRCDCLIWHCEYCDADPGRSSTSIFAFRKSLVTSCWDHYINSGFPPRGSYVSSQNLHPLCALSCFAVSSGHTVWNLRLTKLQQRWRGGGVRLMAHKQTAERPNQGLSSFEAVG